MCDIRIVHAEVIAKAVGPTLKFRVEVKSRDTQAVPVAIAGGLFVPSDTFVAPAFEWADQDRTEASFRAIVLGAAERNNRHETWWNLAVRLTRAELDHIESIRDKDPKKDVHLDLKVAVRMLASTAAPWLMGEVEAKVQPGVRLVATATAPNACRVLMEGGNQNSFLQFLTRTCDVRHRIPAGDWVHEFAPKLGFGNFVVVEVPEVVVSGSDYGERMANAFAAAQKAKQSLQAGEWEDVCQDLRKVWELLRDDQDLRRILKTDGYHDDAATSLCSALNGLFQLASKFDHALAKDKATVLPELHAKKEDAYLAYASAVSILNLIARKFQRTKAKA
jgi:hypothetical protein